MKEASGGTILYKFSPKTLSLISNLSLPKQYFASSKSNLCPITVIGCFTFTLYLNFCMKDKVK